MATANLQRFTSQIHRLASVSFHSKSLISRCSASAPPSPFYYSKKVADRIVNLSAIDPDGQQWDIISLSGHTLLKALTNYCLIDPASHRLDEIDRCSAKCEVNIFREWLDKLPPRSYDEEYEPKRNSRSRTLNKHSRLGCPVIPTHDIQEDTLFEARMNYGLTDPAAHRLGDIDRCSAECEVNIAQEWLDKLPPRSYDEECVLQRNSRSRTLNKHSRLACQVILTHDLQGMVVAVPERKPWDTP